MFECHPKIVLAIDNSSPHILQVNGILVKMDGTMEQVASKNVRLSLKTVAKRYGVHPRTIERWTEDDILQFPKSLYIRRRRYFLAGDLAAWEEIQPDRLGQAPKKQIA